MDDLKKVIEHLRGLLEMVRGHPNLTMVGYFLAMALVEAEEEFARQGFRTRNPPPPQAMTMNGWSRSLILKFAFGQRGLLARSAAICRNGTDAIMRLAHARY
ncbi:hypothetical protein [Neorhizobium sp. LjRoot104]|uniref:hypothetical protein n=1 Tax=Neorhizobium sp. LjRoot104 TaxID=3342254 RepID=UPI003ED07591